MNDFQRKKILFSTRCIKNRKKKLELLLQIIIPWNFSDLFLQGSLSVQYFDHFLNYQVFDIVIQAIKKSKNIKVIQVFFDKMTRN